MRAQSFCDGLTRHRTREAAAESVEELETEPSVAQLDTPVVVVDRRIGEANLDRMATRVSVRGKVLVPHAKTHKSVMWARRQLDLGARALMVAKLEEARGLAHHGFADLSVAGGGRHRTSPMRGSAGGGRRGFGGGAH